MSTRQFVVDRLAELLELSNRDVIPINLEKCINNWSAKKTIQMGDSPALDNPKHMSRYKHKFIEIQTCMRKSDFLKNELLSGRLKTSAIMEMPPNVMWPDGPYSKEVEEGVKRRMAKDTNSILNQPDYKGLFKCNKCRQYKTTYYEMQTRSADEPMTVFITCHVCTVTWKS
jgi:DNA-directed RNA polymerase subunit M/transcription elongation factor TFIIS